MFFWPLLLLCFLHLQGALIVATSDVDGQGRPQVLPATFNSSPGNFQDCHLEAAPSLWEGV